MVFRCQREARLCTSHTLHPCDRASMRLSNGCAYSAGDRMGMAPAPHFRLDAAERDHPGALATLDVAEVLAFTETIRTPQSHDGPNDTPSIDASAEGRRFVAQSRQMRASRSPPPSLMSRTY